MQETDQDRIDAYNKQAEKIRNEINSRPLTDFYPLERSVKAGANMYKCPICNSGEGPKGTGALSIRRTDNRVTCFASGCFGNGKNQGSDTLGALRKIYPDKKEREIFQLCGYDISSDDDKRIEAGMQKHLANTQKAPDSDAHARDADQKPTKSAEEIKADILRFADALPGSAGEAYLTGRGISKETMLRFHIGYDAERRRIILPHNKSFTYYTARSIDKNSSHKHEKLSGIPQPLFNESALYNNAGICFVTEAPLCAISIMQAGGDAIALCGVGTGRLLDALDSKGTSAIIALCLDNDGPGHDAMYGKPGADGGLAAALESRHIKCISVVPSIMGPVTDPNDAGYCKDPNDVLQTVGADEFRRIVKECMEDVLEEQRNAEAAEEAERQEKSGSAAVDSFLESVQTHRYEPIPTGIDELDWVIGGGFIRQQLILLGAAPGAGKTALAQWIFEGMAKRKTAEIIFLNLEMSREQILARSFSRMAAEKNPKIKVSSTSVLQGYKWTGAQRDLILSVAADYKQNIATGISYNPDGVSADLDSIITYIESEASRAEKLGKIAPIICIDYLQIIRGREREDDAAIIKRAVKAFKDYAVNHNTIVFVIMAHNRASNKSGTISQESGRDTSALEYSADLQLGLTFTRLLKREGYDQKSSRDQLTDAERHLLTLKVVKGRFGGEGTEIDLYFEGKTMSYKQIRYDDEFTPVDEPTPFDK